VLPLDTWLLFCLACIALVATPGPNVLYLVSRTLAQGRAAGFVSLAGTSAGVAAHALAAALGLSALLATVPVAYDIVRWAGALYLAWLAWTTWRSHGDKAQSIAPTQVHLAPKGRPRALIAPPLAAAQRPHLLLRPQAWGSNERQLFRQGLLTSLLNPKVALFELALFPQFVSPSHGSVLTQSLVLAATQLALAIAGDSLFVLAAGRVRRYFAARPGWGRWSRRALAGVFGALALRLAWEQKP
jgi:threonine/homoserine/homoserine lactone efflux protein